ncbi:uracil-DNA glycosylase [Clonorchis sinensis]|uniref:Uracil-DNA glycosylase n=1 Tax=Clonorchis sinensis TaxID=79923 RepID=G7Y6Z0_CLOSI|nr:uracil-DNA glycosylase [Clonorchis sinensis]
MSRMEEKMELQELNDRLAQYIDFIHQNMFSPGVSGDLDFLADSVKDKLKDLTGVYTSELDALRRNLDKVALQLAKSQVQLKTASSARDEALRDLDEARTREEQKSKELLALAAQLARVERELENSHHIEDEHENLLKQHKILKTQLEQETVQRTDLQNRLMTATEQLDFKDKLLKEERAAFTAENIQIQLKTVVQEAQKYREKLRSKLDELRKEMGSQMKDTLDRLEKNMEVQLKAEKQRTRAAERHAESIKVERDRTSTLLTSRSDELARCRTELETAQRTVDQLNSTVGEMEKKHQEALDRHRSELDRILSLLDEKIHESAELAGIKVQLDAELATYRSLLEAEESRCHLSPPRQRLTAKPLIKRGVKRTVTEIDTNVDLDALDLRSSLSTSTAAERRSKYFGRKASGTSIRITCSSDGPVHFASADPSDGLVRIFNASDDVVPMGDWRLQFGPTLPGATDHTVLYTFPESQQLKPHSELQLHLCSSAGEQVDHIPVQKRRRLPPAKLYLITDAPIWQPYNSSLSLLDSDGSVRAVCEIKPAGVIHPAGSAGSVLGGSQSNIYSFRITCEANGDVHFEAVESGEGILLIRNAGTKTVPLDGWYLTFKTENHSVNVPLAPEHTEIKAAQEIRVCLPSANSSLPAKRSTDESHIQIITDAPVTEQYNSTFTLYDADHKVRAVGKCEQLDDEDTLIRFPTVILEKSNSSVATSWKQESRTTTKSSAGHASSLADRYGNFLLATPRPRSSVCPAAMPKLPYVNQKPLTAFFTSPKAIAKLSDAKENSITPVGAAETPKSDRTPEKRALEEICLSNTNGQPNPDEDVEVTKRPRMESSTPQQMKSPPPSAWGNFPLGRSSTSALGREDLNKKLAEIKRKLASRPTRSVLTLIQGLHPEWVCVLQQQIESERFQKLADFVAGERARTTAIYPPSEQVFTWSQLCPPSSVRVVILGQDPYHGPKQAHGLAFSVQRPLPPPPSLINMYKEIRSGLPEPAENVEWPPKHGDLSGWARQGVLLLNAVLTVRASSPNSHKDQGWELLTDAVIRHLSKDKSNLVFMLWGSHALKQGAGIDRKRHLVLHAPHPSPLSASRGFFGCGHFTKANDYLREHGLTPVGWTKLD